MDKCKDLDNGKVWANGREKTKDRKAAVENMQQAQKQRHKLQQPMAKQ
jgi:hypothetical protein